MKAEADAFRNRIKGLSFDELVEFTVSGYEKYRELRIRDEENQIIPPAQFIPIAEKNGHIVALGEQVFRKAETVFIGDSEKAHFVVPSSFLSGKFPMFY